MPLVPDIASSAGSVVRHEIITLETTQALQFVDLTERLTRFVQQLDLTDGMLIVQSRHTTAGILVNEHEPLLLEDLRAMFERLVPAAGAYAHDDFRRRTENLTSSERHNGHAHCRAALLRTSETLPICNRRLALGRWQRVFFVDFDGGQPREVWLTALGR